MNDITQKPSLEIEAKLELLFNNMAEGVALHSLVFDDAEKAINYIIEKVNPQYEKILGFNKKSIEGQLASKVYKTEEAPYLKEFSTVAITGTPKSLETYFPPLNKHFSISISPWGKNGFATIFTDTTEEKKAEEQIRSLLKEKELLLRELHHRVTNNVSAIGNLLMLQAESITNPEAASILTDARNRLKSMGLLHKRLYKSDKMEDCQVKDYLSQLIDEIIAVFPNRNIVRIEKDIDDFALSQKTLFPLGIILNELLTNSMKHAFIGKHDALLKVNLSKVDKSVTLVVEDNGKGISVEKAKNSNGFGMTLVNLLADQLKGEFKIDHTKGAKFTFKFEIN